MAFPRVTVRPAEESEIPQLTAWLERQSYFERVNLRQMIVFVAEYDGQVVGFTAGRLIWQVEPVALMEDFRNHAPHFARARATLGLIRAINDWIADRARNTSGIYSYFCVIKGQVMRELALAFGMIRIYRGCGFYGRDV